MFDADQPAEFLGAHRRRAFGAYYTQGNPFKTPAMRDWFAQLPSAPRCVEPFAGTGQIPRLLADAGYRLDFMQYDINRQLPDVHHEDTLERFPRGFDIAITNPPYLSHHFAKRKGIHIDKRYFGGYSSLYQRAIHEALAACRFVAMIIPESFITSGLFRDRLQHFVSHPVPMFADTQMPVGLALWGPATPKTFVYGEGSGGLGLIAIWPGRYDRFPAPFGSDSTSPTAASA